jgi:protein-L-isoaspartate O-methyltransferase
MPMNRRICAPLRLATIAVAMATATAGPKARPARLVHGTAESRLTDVSTTGLEAHTGRTTIGASRVAATTLARDQRGPSPDPRTLAPYVATPPEVVDRMLTLAKVGPRDVVYDLGCGDGRIVIAAAQRFGARGVGIDIDPRLINEAEANARRAGVQNRVKFMLEDAMKVDVSDATVVTLYLLSASNVKLRPLLTKQLRAGARIVSHSFPIGDWEPDVIDSFRDAAGTTRTLYLWNFDGKFRP